MNIGWSLEKNPDQHYRVALWQHHVLCHILQAHSTMHQGHPCSGMSHEYFQDGITNGAHWYSVAGRTILLFISLSTCMLFKCLFLKCNWNVYPGFQAHSAMHLGHSCPNISNDYFQDGITEGRAWYSSSGRKALQSFWIPICSLTCLLTNIARTYFIHILLPWFRNFLISILIRMGPKLQIFLVHLIGQFAP